MTYNVIREIAMGKPGRRFVGRATAGQGWRVWDNTVKRWWGQFYKRHPQQLLDELNGQKRPEVITKLTRDLQIEKNQKPQSRRVGR